MSQKYTINFHKVYPYLTLVIYSFFVYLMIRITLKYIDFNPEAGFLAIKQWVIHNDIWRACFYTHVFCSPLLLLAGFSQFFKAKIIGAKVHRSIGKLYVFVILFLAAPSGLVMAWYANGGKLGQLAFIILGILWMVFTYLAYFYAKRRRFREHRNYMYRSFALTLSAITLRSWKYLILQFFNPNPMDAYILVAWLGFIPNLIIAEWLIAKQKY